MLVDFIIPGAMKSGTSTLAGMLSLHPKVSFSKPKEPQFFSKKQDWREHLEEYHDHFIPAPDVLYGEGSTNYTKYPYFKLELWEDIYAYNPAMKFIYIIRHPIDRIISQYVHSYERGFVSFPAASISRDAHHLAVSRYFFQIQPFIDRFGREQVLILDFADLVEKPVAIFRQSCQFLNLDPDLVSEDQIRNLHINKTRLGSRYHHKYDRLAILKLIKQLSPRIWGWITKNRKRNMQEKPRLSKADQMAIIRYLEQDIVAMQELMGKDLSHWFVPRMPYGDN